MATINMVDIARISGVSMAIVSRAVHSPHKVRSAVKKHNHVYNAADSSRRHSKMIGLLIPTTRSPVFAGSILAIQGHCRNSGYAVILGNTRYDAATEINLRQQFRERRVAGVILTGFTFDCQTTLVEHKGRGIPPVVIWEKLNDPGISYVGFDNFLTANKMTTSVLPHTPSRRRQPCGLRVT